MIDCGDETDDIIEAMIGSLRLEIEPNTIYGDGHAGEKISQSILKLIPNISIQKRFNHV